MFLINVIFDLFIMFDIINILIEEMNIKIELVVIFDIVIGIVIF